MFSYTVTIGRNIDGEPMPSNLWLEFIEAVLNDMETLFIPQAGDAMETHQGLGTWNGVTEESVKITLLTDHKVDDNQLNAIREFMSENARSYGQDAIAFTVGNSELITS